MWSSAAPCMTTCRRWDLLSGATSWRCWSCCRSRRATWPQNGRSSGVHAGLIFVTGAVGTALFNVLMYVALDTTTAISAALLVALSPVLIPVLAYYILGERLTGRLALGIAVSLLGVLAIVTRGDPAVLADMSFRTGDLIMFATMLCWSLYSVLVKRKPPDLGPYTFLAAILIFTVPTLLPFYIWESLTIEAMPMTAEAVAAAVYIGAFPTALALLLYNRAVLILGANRAGPYNNLVPVFATVLAILFLGERLAVFHIVGAALIAGGLYLATVSRSVR